MTEPPTSRPRSLAPDTFAALAMLGLAGASCQAARTEILVWVSTDMPTTGPAALNHLVITAWQSGQAVRHATWSTDDAGADLQSGRVVAVLYPGDNGSRSEVTVTVMSYHLGPGCGGGDGCPLYPTDSPGRAIANLVPGQTLLVQIPLWSTCASVPCLPNETCNGGVCVDARQHPATFDGSFPGPLDATTDTAFDAPSDANDTVAACDAGFTNCSGVCVNVSNDTSNCGRCGHVCGTMFDTCSSGSCSCSGFVCGSTCYSNNDLRHCGNCSTNCQAMGFQRCKCGTCCNPPACPPPC